VIHDILPTNERLVPIHQVNTDGCRNCERVDNLQHRLSECKEGTAIWECTRRRVALMLRMESRQFPDEWPLRPHFHFWPQRRQRTLLWALAHLIWYSLQGEPRQTLVYLIDFLRQTRWKAYERPHRPQRV
jgi:hypothetical protein